MLLVKTHPVVRGIKIGSNQPPQWQSVPTPSFVFGTASNYPPSGTYQSNGYVTDANSDTITITWITGSISGVSWDGGKFVYTGGGSVGTTGSLVLRASDGVDTTDSSAFSIEIASNLAWFGTPSVSFAEASVVPFSLGSYITNYNSSTDEFRVTPGYSLPLWLSLTAGPGSGSGNLTPNGTQVDANDIPASPGIKIDVRRSGGAWVSSAAFGVTVYALSAAVATWRDVSLATWNANLANGEEQRRVYVTPKDPLVTSEAEYQTYVSHVPYAADNLDPVTPIWSGFSSIVSDDEYHYVVVIPG